MADGERMSVCVLMVLGLMFLPAGLAGPCGAAGDDIRAIMVEGADNDSNNNDDFLTARELASGNSVDGATDLNDSHRIDTYVLRDVYAGKVINASLQLMDFNQQALLLSAWNEFHSDSLAWSNREDNPDRREWEALSFLCVISGDYYIQIKPIAGQGTVHYRLNVCSMEPEDISAKIGSGGVFGETIPGKVSSFKWYPGQWYRFQMNGEQDGLNDYLYVNMTLPGGPEERLQGDLYVRNLEPESWSYWLNHSWWLCSHVQYEEVHVAACHPGVSWYYVDVQAYNTTGGRSEAYELRLTKSLIESDGDNHPLNATKVTYEQGKTTIRRQGSVMRGPDMVDWYRVFQKKGGGLSANLTLQERSAAIIRLSIYRDNATGKGYDLMGSWTNKPADQVLNRVNALATNVTQEGWYYIGIIAQIGLMPGNATNLADWTVQTAWADYTIDLTLGCSTSHSPQVVNPPPDILMSEDGADSSLKLNFTGANRGIFWDGDMDEDWGDLLRYNASGGPELQVSIADPLQDPEATATITPARDWNGEANITFTATDLYGKANSTVVHVRVTPVNDPPFIKNRIPDFQVKEGDTNNTMKDIDLFQVFGDPDFPPLGDDNLTFSLDNRSYPSAVIVDAKLTFGPAPVFPGKDNHVILLTLAATDKANLKVSQVINITVINRNQPPERDHFCMLEILEDAIFYLDLNKIFNDPDDDQLTFTYLGGASGNLSVEMTSNGIVVLTPAMLTVTKEEYLRFRATDSSGLSTSGEQWVRIRHSNRPPDIREMVPDPLEDITINEGGSLTLHVTALDIDNRSSDLRYAWSIDNAPRTLQGGPSFTWRPTFDDAGLHSIKLRVSDGLSFTDAEWNITVLNTNRPPVVLRAWPMNNTEILWDTKVRFSAEAEDPDGGLLVFRWTMSDGTLLRLDSGTKSSLFSRQLPSGKQHIVVLDVMDSDGGTTREYFYIKVGEQPDTTEIPWLPLGTCALAATAVAMLALSLRGRAKRISQDR